MFCMFIFMQQATFCFVHVSYNLVLVFYFCSRPHSSCCFCHLWLINDFFYLNRRSHLIRADKHKCISCTDIDLSKLGLISLKLLWCFDSVWLLICVCLTKSSTNNIYVYTLRCMCNCFNVEKRQTFNVDITKSFNITNMHSVTLDRFRKLHLISGVS